MDKNMLSNIDAGGGLFGDSSDEDPMPKKK